MPPTGFETTIPACERPQTYALDRAAIGTGKHNNNNNNNNFDYSESHNVKMQKVFFSVINQLDAQNFVLQ